MQFGEPIETEQKTGTITFGKPVGTEKRAVSGGITFGEPIRTEPTWYQKHIGGRLEQAREQLSEPIKPEELKADPVWQEIYGGMTGPPEFNETEFQKWYGKIAKKWNLDPNPDNPLHYYDYRAAYMAGAKPDKEGHWPSEFKTTDHPNRYVGGIDTITGLPKNPYEKYISDKPIEEGGLTGLIKEGIRRGYRGVTGIEKISKEGKFDPTEFFRGTVGEFETVPEPTARSAKNVLAITGKAFAEGTASFFDTLDKFAQEIEKNTGLERGKAFEWLSQRAAEKAEWIKPKISDPTLGEEWVGEFLGGAIPGIIEFALNIPFAAAKGYVEGGVKKAGVEAAKRALMGKIFKALHILKPAQRAAAMTTVFGTEAASTAAAEGASLEEVIKAGASGAGTGLGFAMMGGSAKGMTFREAAKVEKPIVPEKKIPSFKEEARKFDEEKAAKKEREQVKKPEVPREDYRPAKVRIPHLGSTEEAIEFGKKATPEQLERMSEMEKDFRSAAAKYVWSGDYQLAMDVGTAAQFLREARETAEAKKPAPEKVAPVPKEVAPKAPKLKVVRGGKKESKPKTFKGVYYWKDYGAAKQWAEDNNWPTDRIIEYERGYAVQSGKGGNYAGPEVEPKPWTGPPAEIKIKEPKPSKVRTLRGAIKEFGGINFGNFKGELKNLPVDVKYLSKKSGMPLDLAEKALKDDGWLYPKESLLEVLEKTDNLKRDRVGREVGEKKEHELTEQERELKKQMAWEPEAPPEGEYISIRAEDLPEGKKVTLIEDRSKSGWDVYEVDKSEAPFEIKLIDGETITLKPMDRVQILKEELAKPSPRGLRAALKTPEGEVFASTESPGNHEVPYNMIKEKYPDLTQEQENKLVSGFVEPDGKFITTNEATAKYGEGSGPKGEFISEDVAKAKKETRKPETPTETFARMEAEDLKFAEFLDSQTIGTKVKVPRIPGAYALEGTWEKVELAGDPFWKNIKTDEYRPSSKLRLAKQYFDEQLEKPKPTLELKGEKETAVGIARLKRKGREMPKAKQETLTTAFETAKDKGVKGLRIEGEKAGKKEAESFRKATSEIGAEVDKVIDKMAQRGSVEVAGLKAPEVKGEKFEFQDKEVGARIDAAQGARKESVLKRMGDFFVSLGHKITRDFEYLPRGAEFSKLGFELRKLAKAKGISSKYVLDALKGIIYPLNKNEFKIYRAKVLFDDFDEELKIAESEKREIKLPFKITREILDKELGALDEWIKDNPKVQEALEKRKKLWNSLRKDYISANEAVGHNVESKLTREKYYRHQILDYANLKGIFGTGKRLKTPHAASYLKRRTGKSELDINTNYIEAEYEVMGQMLYDIKRAKVLKYVQDTQSVHLELRQQAKDKNYENIVGGKENLSRLNQLRGEKAEILSQKPLDSGDKQRLKELNEEIWDIDPTMPYRQKIARGISGLEKELGLKELGEDYIGEIDFNTIKDLADEGNPNALAILKGIVDRERFVKQELGEEYLEWKGGIDRRLIPEGYEPWQPREGNTFYMTDTVPAKLAEQLYSGAMEELGITKDDLGRALAIGGRRKELVVKHEVAQTLNNLSISQSNNPFIKASRGILKAWKIWQITSPRRYTKFQTRNISGDADATFVGNPKAFVRTPQAVKELSKVFFRGGEMTEDLAKFHERGGFGGTLRMQEIGDINELKMFSKFLEEKSMGRQLSDIPAKTWKGYWNAVKLTTDFRESILRYANFLEYVDQMKSDPKGKPKNFGASRADEVMALDDIYDRAYMLQNDLVGAYDRVGIMGQTLRSHLWPYWSWKEANFRRYIQLIKNSANDGKFAEAVGRKALGTVIRSPLIAARIGKFLIKATGLWVMLQVYNHTRYPEEEDDLPEDVRSRPHIIFGRDKNGEVLYFSRLGAFGDFLEWFGLDAAPEYYDQWAKGRRTLKEIAMDMAKSPINVAVQGTMPFAKLGYELLDRQALFPDAFKPSAIRDRMLHAARSFGLENEYLALSGKPSKPWTESLKNLFVYSTDPFQAAYSDIYNEKQRFLKKIGMYGEGFWLTPKGNILYNMKLAMRYNDKEAFDRYQNEYMQKYGQHMKAKEIRRSMEASFDSMNPLSGLSKDKKKPNSQAAFLEYLGEDGNEKILKAMKFYEQIMDPDLNAKYYK